MEDLIVLILFFVAVGVLNSKNKKKKKTAQKAPQVRKASTPVAPQPAVPKKVPDGEAMMADTFESSGSIEMPKPEPHVHEGKEAPCPAQVREQHAEAQQKEKFAPVAEEKRETVPVLNISANALVQSVVMSEILTKPRFENGRRVIR